MESPSVSLDTFPPQTRILLVEDIAHMREVLKTTLTQLGYTSVDDFGDGQQAYSALLSARSGGANYQLVISDFSMPKVNGMELLMLIRNSPSWKSLPFLMVTDLRDSASILGAISAGVNGYILKPVEPAILSSKLSTIWKKQNAKGHPR